MTELPPCGELQQAYESLRAQATRRLTPATPRGLALVLAKGLPAWMAVWATRAAAPAPPAAAASGARLAPDGLNAELVRVLTEMALAGQRRCNA